VVYEKDDKVGGIMRYGIPDFKLEKNIIDRRLDILKQEGVTFITGTNVGMDISAQELKEVFREIAEERGEINRRRLGRWIARHQGQVVNGRRLEKVSTKNSAEKWQVVQVK
jgi:NADPH-dependent glutamate synthase beta subunit-like oxidoreductase